MGNATASTDQRRIFRLAGLYNFGILLVSRGLGPNLGAIDTLFDVDGCISILLWGMAYAAVGECHQHAPWASLVFAIEKLFYFFKWVSFWKTYSGTVEDLLASDPAFIFFIGYGPGDLAFGLFFLKAFLDHRGGGGRRTQKKND